MFDIRNIRLAGLSGILLVAACSATVAVTGGLDDGSETFTGTMEAGMSMDAPFTITSSTGTVCNGTIVMDTLTRGRGEFACDDGRSGLLDIRAAAGSITGTGTIAGAPLTLLFR